MEGPTISVIAASGTWQLHLGGNFQVYGMDWAPSYWTPTLLTTPAGADGGHRTANIDGGPDSFDTVPSSVADYRLGETPGTVRDTPTTCASARALW